MPVSVQSTASKDLSPHWPIICQVEC